MLSWDEETKLNEILVSPGEFFAPYELEWLAEKLKEVNEELKTANIYSSTVAKELNEFQKKHQELDKMLATALQVINDAGIMDEYLKFRNQ